MNAQGDMIDGRFELIDRLGSGGMGTVWRARDTVLDRNVALKAVHPDAEASHALRERVMREARALARLNDPHVVTVHQIIDTHPHPWIVMELVPGRSLQQRLSEGPLSPAESARIGRQVLAALRVAHAAGIQHRDVKPANVLLRPDGHAVLTDFGIAALQGA
ncbi:serine/threonine-protein kinase, partial [Streptomyces populi]